MSENVREWKLRPMQVPNDLRVALVIGEHNFDDMTEVVEKQAYDRLAEINKVLVEALEWLVIDVQDYETWQRPCAAVTNAQAALAKAKEMGK